MTDPTPTTDGHDERTCPDCRRVILETGGDFLPPTDPTPTTEPSTEAGCALLLSNPQSTALLRGILAIEAEAQATWIESGAVAKIKEDALREAAEWVRALAVDTDDDGERERREFGWYGAIAAAVRAILTETER